MSSKQHQQLTDEHFENLFNLAKDLVKGERKKKKKEKKEEIKLGYQAGGLILDEYCFISLELLKSCVIPQKKEDLESKDDNLPPLILDTDNPSPIQNNLDVTRISSKHNNT